jgi:FMN phosphatase YigB (HAD superfamily)
VAVSFDLFGTLIVVDRPEDPASAVAAALRERDVVVPNDWAETYGEAHLDASDGVEVPLSNHVAAALASRGIEASDDAVRRAVAAAFDPDDFDVRVRDGVPGAIDRARETGPVGLCSNSAVSGLVARTLARVGLRDSFDAIVTSVDCGWRKPDPRIFETLGVALDVDPASIVHVGDQPRTDGGIEAVGGRFCDVTDVPLSAIAAGGTDPLGGDRRCR